MKKLTPVQTKKVVGGKVVGGKVVGGNWWVKYKPAPKSK